MSSVSLAVLHSTVIHNDLMVSALEGTVVIALLGMKGALHLLSSLKFITSVQAKSDYRQDGEINENELI